MSSTTPSDGTTASGPSKKVIGSAVVVAVIVVLGLVLSLVNLFDQTDPTPTTQPVPPVSSGTSSTSTPTPPSDTSVCGLEAVEMSGTVSTAPSATWALVGTIAAPSIEGQGPGKIDDDGYRSCFARTPTGAVLAAANYSAVGSHGPLRKKFNEQATAPGPGRDALLQKPVTGAGDGGTRVQIAGFRLLHYDGKTADVDIALRTSTGALAAMVFNLEWAEGDWKLRLADDGTELSPVSQIPSLSGYILWSGA